MRVPRLCLAAASFAHAPMHLLMHYVQMSSPGDEKKADPAEIIKRATAMKVAGVRRKRSRKSQVSTLAMSGNHLHKRAEQSVWQCQTAQIVDWQNFDKCATPPSIHCPPKGALVITSSADLAVMQLDILVYRFGSKTGKAPYPHSAKQTLEEFGVSKKQLREWRAMCAAV